MQLSFQEITFVTTHESAGLIMVSNPHPEFQYSTDRSDQTNLPGNQINAVCRPNNYSPKE